MLTTARTVFNDVSIISPDTTSSSSSCIVALAGPRHGPNLENTHVVSLLEVEDTEQVEKREQT